MVTLRRHPLDAQSFEHYLFSNLGAPDVQSMSFSPELPITKRDLRSLVASAEAMTLWRVYRSLPSPIGA